MRGKAASKMIKGGNFLVQPSTWSPYIVLWLMMAVMVVAVLFVVVSTTTAATRNNRAPEVRVVVVEKPSAATSSASPKPPVYPDRNPSYPLRGVEQEFQQVGVLVSQDANDDQPVILPLFGRKMSTRDRWEYYVASDKFHMWRLPVQFKNRMCEDDVGCEEIYQGDEVVVPDYANKVFIARIYKYDSPKYN